MSRTVQAKDQSKPKRQIILHSKMIESEGAWTRKGPFTDPFFYSQNLKLVTAWLFIRVGGANEESVEQAVRAVDHRHGNDRTDERAPACEAEEEIAKQEDTQPNGGFQADIPGGVEGVYKVFGGLFVHGHGRVLTRLGGALPRLVLP